jgi:hypothetical protein
MSCWALLQDPSGSLAGREPSIGTCLVRNGTMLSDEARLPGTEDDIVDTLQYTPVDQLDLPFGDVCAVRRTEPLDLIDMLSVLR